MKIGYLLFAFILLTGGTLYGDEIDTLLQAVQKKSDLSEKTKLANAGVSFVWTRDDLDRMQISNLKQILKTLYPMGYRENRFGLVDPLGPNTFQPFMSSIIRVYIDNQEITTGLYGSGIGLIGDTNIDWVDHVEIYTQNPTYEYATEATITLIKLYSKSVAKDEGSMLKLSGGSYGAYNVDGYNAGWIKDWSYFVYAYHGNDKRKKYHNLDQEISRDKRSNAFLATLHKGQTNILLNGFTQNRDAFMSFSMDGTPLKAPLNAKYLHIGIDSKIGNVSYLFTYDYTRSHFNFLDDVTPIEAPPFYGLFPIRSVENYTHSHVLTGELKYRFKRPSDTLLTGLKYRSKRGDWDKSTINGVDMSIPRDKAVQNIATAFMENQYRWNDHAIITTGLEYERVTNSDSVQNDDLWMYRIGYTFTTQAWTLKSFYSHTLFTLEPYLIKSHTFLAHPEEYYDPAAIDTVLFNSIYEKKRDRYELILDYSTGKDFYVPLDKGKIVTYDNTLKMYDIDVRWTRQYRQFDKLFLRCGYRIMKNIPDFMINDYTYKELLAVVRNVNTFDRFDIFNELVFTRSNPYQKYENSCNYSVGLKYHYNDSLSFMVKGVNLFDDAKKTFFPRVDPVTLQPETPLEVSSIDRAIRFAVEWVF